MKVSPIYLLLCALPIVSYAQQNENLWDEEPPEESPVEVKTVIETVCEPDPRWYFELKPGYFFFTDASMRQFYNNGGFTIRGEAGCRVWGPLTVWMDGGYFSRDGKTLGGEKKTDIMIGTLTLGLKLIHQFNSVIGVYAGAGPRLFMMILHNDSPYIRGEDNQVGIGGGFDAGFWLFPFARYKSFVRNLFIDVFADYSLKTLKTEEDALSSEDFDVNVSGITGGIGLGIRF